MIRALWLKRAGAGNLRVQNNNRVKVIFLYYVYEMYLKGSTSTLFVVDLIGWLHPQSSRMGEHLPDTQGEERLRKLG